MKLNVEEANKITKLTVRHIRDGKDSSGLIRRMIEQEKYEELQAIKRGYEMLGKEMPNPLEEPSAV